MYQLLLTRRYLLRKIMPMLAAIAVVLITATELITWSVMGGFLRELVRSGTGMAGDLTIEWPSGIRHYDALVAELERDPRIEAACPAINALVMASLPDGRSQPVQVWGVDPVSFARVTTYSDSLWWRPMRTAHPKDVEEDDPRLRPLPDFMRMLRAFNPDDAGVRVDTGVSWEQLLEAGLTLKRTEAGTGRALAAAVPGIEMMGLMHRRQAGLYVPGMRTVTEPDGSSRSVARFAPMEKITLTFFPVDSIGRATDQVTRVLPIANEFRAGVLEIDSNFVIVPLDVVQNALNMDRARLSKLTPQQVAQGELGTPGDEAIEPARVTAVMARAAEGVTLAQAKEAAIEAYAAFAQKHAGAVPSPDSVQIKTYEERNAMFIGAVKKEIVLVMFIFGVISLTSVFLVLAIFWSMISEKTRDIGIMRALGASRLGVALWWVGYGLALGLGGSALGCLAAIVVVRNINPIHEWIGALTGTYIWDPSVYYFVEIPNQVEWTKVAIIFGAGVAACALGAAWPALRAALMHPVRALRAD